MENAMASQTVFFMLVYSCWFKEVSHFAELRVAMRHKLSAVQGIQLRQAAAQVKAQTFRRGVGVLIGAARRFGDDAVDQTERLEILGSEPQGRRRLFGLAGIAV